MPQQIEVPNYGVVEFPDDMTDAQITQAIKKNALNYKTTREAKPSKVDVLDNIGNLAYRLTPLGLLESANDVGSKITNIEREFLGDKTLDATGSPAAATAAYMAPDILNLGAASKFASIPLKAAPKNELGKAAERIGFKPTIPQVTKSRDWANVYDAFANMPGSAGVIARHEAKNQAAVNSAVSRAIGQKSDAVTGDVLASASDELGSVRNELRSQVNIPRAAPTILKSIDDASAELKKSLKNTGKFKSDTERIKQGIQSGNITGEQYQIWRTDLRDEVDTAYRAGKTKLAEAYKKILTSLDDAARQGAGDAWKANDKQFATLEMIQKGNIVNPVTGDVSAPLLTNQLFRDMGKAAKQGRVPGEIADIATITKGYPTLKEGSATARRENYDSIIPWALSPLNYFVAKGLVSNPAGFLRLGPYGVPAAGAIQGAAGALPETEQ